MHKDDAVYSRGGEAKSISGDKFGGQLIVFSGTSDPDLANEFFDFYTDYFLSDGQNERPGFWNHGYDVEVGNRKIATGTITKDSVGIWLEAQMTARDEYCEMIMEMIKQGKLGLSSGSIGHICRKEQVTPKVKRISSWPIAEFSLTNVPCEPRTHVGLIKTTREMQYDLNCLQHDKIKRYMNRSRQEQFNANCAKLDRIRQGVNKADLEKQLRIAGIDFQLAQLKKRAYEMQYR